MEDTIKRYQRLADIEEIQAIQSRYVFYLDEFNYKGILEHLIAKNHPEVCVEIEESGGFVGPEQVKNLLTGLHEMANTQSYGVMPMTTLASPYIAFNADESRAQGTWTYFGPNAMDAVEYPNSTNQLTAFWTGGKIINEFCRIDSEWKILKINMMNWFRTPFDQGWIKQADCRRFRIPQACVPDTPSVVRTYHPAAYYSANGPYNYGPFAASDGEF